MPRLLVVAKCLPRINIPRPQIHLSGASSPRDTQTTVCAFTSPKRFIGGSYSSRCTTRCITSLRQSSSFAIQLCLLRYVVSSHDLIYNRAYNRASTNTSKLLLFEYNHIVKTSVFAHVHTIQSERILVVSCAFDLVTDQDLSNMSPVLCTSLYQSLSCSHARLFWTPQLTAWALKARAKNNRMLRGLACGEIAIKRSNTWTK